MHEKVHGLSSHFPQRLSLKVTGRKRSFSESGGVRRAPQPNRRAGENERVFFCVFQTTSH